MNGVHLIGDLGHCQCPPSRLTDASLLESRCHDLCRQYGLTVVGGTFHTFAAGPKPPGGVTGALVLAESHLTLHTWPEFGSVTLDLYVCNVTRDHGPAARAVFRALIDWFSPESHHVTEVIRSNPAGHGASGTGIPAAEA